MGGMILKLVPVLVRHLLGPPGMPAWSYSWCFLDLWLLKRVLIEAITCLRLPTLLHPLLLAIRDITLAVKKVAQNPVVLAS